MIKKIFRYLTLDPYGSIWFHFTLLKISYCQTICIIGQQYLIYKKSIQLGLLAMLMVQQNVQISVFAFVAQQIRELLRAEFAAANQQTGE